MRKHYLLFFFCPLFFQCTSPQAGIPLRAGMLITQSVRILPGTYFLPASDSLETGAITIEGENIVVDFQGALLQGDTIPTHPDAFKGLGILVRSGQNITIKNVSIRGYKAGILANEIEQLRITNCDLSYNYRQRLGSNRNYEDIADWLSFHQNEADEWLRYGVAIYLKNCNQAQVDHCIVSGGENALMMRDCNEGLFFNNEFTFNSGVGIGLYRSSRNRIMHNRLDWNVRGYSHQKYQRGQDAAGILVYTESNENTIAYNSATHCGDGLFLWAGQATLDTGEGGSNDNLVFGNDFSYAATNGVEVTFSSNQVINNRIEGCTYGIWGGYSHHSMLGGNYLKDNQYGIAIEHGQDNYIDRNMILNSQTGIYLWERRTPPAWGYVQAVDTRSRDYLIVNNVISKVDTPLKVMRSGSISASSNTFRNFSVLLSTDRAVDFSQNTLQTMTRPYQWIAQNEWVQDSSRPLPSRESIQMAQYAPARIPGGKSTLLPTDQPSGRDQIYISSWGPYDFQYPLCRLIDSSQTGKLTFEVLGPQGIWKINRFSGLEQLSAESGSMPATFTAQVSQGETLDLQLDLSYVGEAVRDVFGREFPAAQPFAFSYRAYHKPLTWAIAYYAWNEFSHPLEQPEAFAELLTRTPRIRLTSPWLRFHWWEAPNVRVPADRFATVAETTATFPAGSYQIDLSADDGVKLFIDDQLVYEDWRTGEARHGTLTTNLSGEHRFRVAHFDDTGFASLQFDIRPAPMTER